MSTKKDETTKAMNDEKGGSGTSSSATRTASGRHQARAALEEAEASLVAVLRDADAQIASLRQDKEVAAKRLQYAKCRFETAKEMTTRLCHDCWNVLPALGKNFDDPRTLARNAPNCACCDQPTNMATGDKSEPSRSSQQRTAFKMPPSDMTALESSWKARAQAEEVGRRYKLSKSISLISAESNHGRARTRMPRRRSKSENEIRSGSRGTRGLPAVTSSHDDNTTYLRKEKKESKTMAESKEVALKARYLHTAKKQLDDAHTEVAELDRAIRSWEKYRSQHKEALLTNRMVSEKCNIISRRSSNESNCSSSGTRSQKHQTNEASAGDKMKRQTNSNKDGAASAQRNMTELEQSMSSIGTDDTRMKCTICFDHAKDVVFQCGHQCCKSCSSKLAHCPTCRQPIKQRITLFG